MTRPPRRSTLFPYTPPFRSGRGRKFPPPKQMRAPVLLTPPAQQPTATADTAAGRPCKVIIDSVGRQARQVEVRRGETNVFAGGGVLAHFEGTGGDRESTRLNSSHSQNSYGLFFFKKKKKKKKRIQ